MKQGSFANHAGAVAEGVACDLLRGLGYCVLTHRRICESIYGHDIRTDLLVTNAPGFPTGLAIEIKWQDAAGSVDEKFPYLVANIREKFPCPAVVVVAGGGQKQGSIQWLKGQTDGEKLVAVLTLDEFVSWALRDLPRPEASA